MVRLPRGVQEVADAIGREKALELIGKIKPSYHPSHPNERRLYLYVPTLANLKPDHALVRMIGYPSAEKLSLRFGSELLKLATCENVVRAHRNKEIAEMLKGGSSEEMVAEWFKMTIKSIRSIDRRMGIMERLCGPGVANGSK